MEQIEKQENKVNADKKYKKLKGLWANENGGLDGEENGLGSPFIVKKFEEKGLKVLPLSHFSLCGHFLPFEFDNISSVSVKEPLLLPTFLWFLCCFHKTTFHYHTPFQILIQFFFSSVKFYLLRKDSILNFYKNIKKIILLSNISTLKKREMWINSLLHYSLSLSPWLIPVFPN